MTIRPAEDADLPAILNLFKISLGEEGGIPEESFWKWKHFDNPFGKSPTLLAFEGNTLIGLRTFLKWRFRYQGELISAYRAVDTATHPDYRGKGIFRKLSLRLIEDLREKEPSVIFNTPNKLSAPGYLKMGWVTAGKTPLMIRPMPLNLIRNRIQPNNSVTEGYHSWNEQAEKIWTDLSNGLNDLFRDSLTTDYNSQYLRWRYFDIPGFRYRFAYADDAIIIYRIKQGRLLELRICEVLLSSKECMAVRKLIREIIRAHRPDVVTVLNDHQNVISRNLPFGFIPASSAGLTVTTREVNEARLVNFFTNHRWALSSGTFELF